jgi:hypothetical protein
MELLEKISNVAAAAHAPFMSSASHELFNLASFTELDQPRDLAKIFDTTEYAKWKAFRASEDSRYVALGAPRVLVREPYGSTTVPIEAFNYEERVDGTDHGAYLWGNGAYALAANVNKAFAMYGWCASIRGVESGGLVEGLPVHNFRTEAGELVMKCPTEVQVTDRREKELADLGFAALVHQKGTANAAFFSVQSCQKPKVYDTPQATASARLSAQLPYIFATSRFAHYLKVMMRDKIGGYTSRAQIDSFLNRWIQNYVTGEDAAASIKAQRPLAGRASTSSRFRKTGRLSGVLSRAHTSSWTSRCGDAPRGRASTTGRLTLQRRPASAGAQLHCRGMTRDVFPPTSPLTKSRRRTMAFDTYVETARNCWRGNRQRIRKKIEIFFVLSWCRHPVDRPRQLGHLGVARQHLVVQHHEEDGHRIVQAVQPAASANTRIR